MAVHAAVMDFLAMRSARRQPKTRGSWLYGAGPFALIVATGVFMVGYDVPYWWAILVIVVEAVVVCPALVLLATVVFDRREPRCRLPRQRRPGVRHLRHAPSRR
ncbi:MAG: hypothetical protein ABI382_08920 [Nakamurella sp.]